MNPWRAPQRVLLRHHPNQRASLRGDGRSAVASATLPRPEQTEALALPSDDGLSLHNHDGRSPIAPCACQPRPEASVRFRQAQPSRSGPLHNLQLMPQREDLKVERGTCPDQALKRRQSGNQHRHHCD